MKGAFAIQTLSSPYPHPILASHLEMSRSGDVTPHRNSKESDVRIENVDLEGQAVSTPDRPIEHCTHFSNRWSKIRDFIREPAAEFFGVFILVIFGCGTTCQVVLSANPNVSPSPKGSYLASSFGWAGGAAFGVWVSGGISGGHINPAVTLAFATFRNFPWRKVPAYIFAQVLGGFVGAGLVYANYIYAIDIVEGGRHIRTVPPESPGTAALFSTYALSYMPNGSCILNEFLGTMVLLIGVCAITDTRNAPPPTGLVPLAIFILVLAIANSIGMQTGYAINPARDLGPRLLTACIYSSKVFTFKYQYWIWCPILSTILGGLFGVFLYDTFIFTGNESVINRRNRVAREAHLRAPNTKTHQPSARIATVS